MCISWELHTSSTGSITLMNQCCFSDGARHRILNIQDIIHFMLGSIQIAFLHRIQWQTQIFLSLYSRAGDVLE